MKDAMGPTGRQPLTISSKLCIGVLMPFLALYWLLSFLLAYAVTFLVVPSLFLAKRLYWACPFVPHIWQRLRQERGAVAAAAVKVGFEASYCISVLCRLLTLPMRPHLPDFYIVGFPKSGTTTLAHHLRCHPAISGIAGLPWEDALSKESHFLMGILGRAVADAPGLFRSCFPTVMRRCFDACPTYACLPFMAERLAQITPTAKIIIMMRDPVAGVFSAECMLREMGCPLTWSLAEELRPGDLAETKEERAHWEQLEALRPGEPLPADMPERFYFRLSSYIRAGMYAQRVEPFLRHFPADHVMFVDFKDFVTDTRTVVEDVLHFVGADPARLSFKPVPPKMKTDYQGRSIHPSVKPRLQQLFAPSNRRLVALLGRDLSWTRDAEKAPAPADAKLQDGVEAD